MVTSEEKFKHLTDDSRMEIQNGLNSGCTFKQIARRIGKDPTTVSKEVKKHIDVRPAKDEASAASPCELLLKAPFVCNGCKRVHYCRKERHIYAARKAHAEYRELLSEARTGIILEKEEFYKEDKLLYDAVKNHGQHIYHAVKALKLKTPVSSVYRYIAKGYMSCLRIDLPRAAKFKPRKTDGKEPHLTQKQKKGHIYEEFLEYCAAEEITNWVETDTVIGRPGGKTLMTFDFTVCNFMFALLLNDKSAAEAAAAIEKLKDRLGRAGFSFGEVIPLLLADNGSEFTNIAAFENALDGKKETMLFFAKPYCSSDKPHVEKNHTLLRDILPKGSSFDNLTQKDINLVMSHMNGVIRKNLHGKSSYDVFTAIFSPALAKTLGVSYVSPDKVEQSPDLLKEKLRMITDK